MQIPRILITATSSGAGKTMLTCGILQALKTRGYRSVAFKCGPDYIDPMFHKRVIDVDSFNLDSFLCGQLGVKEVLCRYGSQAEIAVLEGVMGYYDGIGGISTEASAYEIARITETPSILVIDCKGASVSILPVIQGFLEFQKDSRIQGVILNRLSPMMYGRMKHMIEERFDLAVLGYVPVLPWMKLESRHLGLKMPNEIRGLQEQLEQLGQELEKTLDLDGILAIASSANEVKPCKREVKEKKTEKIPVGIAMDEAFCFRYKDNLEILEELGVELLTFSPLRDSHLPKGIKGLIFYGGYPELFAKRLSENGSLKQEIYEALQEGMPCMAECGGFQYLQEQLEGEDGTLYDMVGYLSGKSVGTGSLKRFGYITLTGGTVFGQEVGEIPAHEFHYYDSEENGTAFLAKKPRSNREWNCMISTDTLFAGYPHINYRGNEKVAEAFVNQCKRTRT